MKRTLHLILIFLITFIQDLSAQEAHFTIKNLAFNDNKSHYGVTYFKDNEVYLTSYQLDDRNRIRKDHDDLPIFSVFKGTMSSDGEINDLMPFEKSASYEFNSSSVSFSPDKRYMFITTNYVDKDDFYKRGSKTRNLRIERGEYIPGKGWSNFKTLPFCDSKYSYGHPAVSPDGKYLFFVANIPEAKGPTDIFKVSILGDNEYGDIERLDNLVNSSRKEMFPYFTKDNKLYFASDRAGGYKGLDIYYSEMDEDGKFHKPVLLPKPINSDSDDFALMFLDDEETKGYFSSRRESGRGDDDIYYFTLDSN